MLQILDEHICSLAIRARKDYKVESCMRRVHCRNLQKFTVVKSNFKHRKLATIKMAGEAVARPTRTPVSRVLCLLTVFGFIRIVPNVGVPDAYLHFYHGAHQSLIVNEC